MVVGYHALQRLATGKSARSHTAAPLERGLLYWMVVDIMQKAFMFCPVLGAAAGYLVDGGTGALSGFVIPMGPLIVLWLFGAH